MSSSHSYPSMAGTVDPQQMCLDTTGTEWYAPSSVCLLPEQDAIDEDGLVSQSLTARTGALTSIQFSYSDAYATPYPSSTVESQPWPSYTRATGLDLTISTYPYQQQQSIQPPHFQSGFRNPGRPKSSPSTFGPSADSAWPTTSGLGIQFDVSTAGQTPPVTSTFPPTVFPTFSMGEQYSTSSPPEIRQPQPRRPYANIAPSPQSTTNVKRGRDDDDQAELVSEFGGKRRKRTSSVASADLSEDDRFLVQLKEDESLPWKDIANRFQTDKGKNLNVAALQMRYKRLREKFRVWEDQDVNALKLAYEYWERNKWDIISAKMLEYGLNERWPPRHCARKWQEIEAQMAFTRATTGSLGGTPQVSSPVEGPIHHFGFVPMQ